MTSEDLDRDVRLFVFQHFVETARPPSVKVAADGMGITLAEATAAYERLATNRVLVLEPGTHEIRMANPLSAIPTAFAVSVDGRSLYGNCIWDALGVVAMLGGSGRISSSCACCHEPMPLEVAGFQLGPVDGVVHFAVPAAHWWDDIVFT